MSFSTAFLFRSYPHSFRGWPWSWCLLWVRSQAASRVCWGLPQFVVSNSWRHSWCEFILPFYASLYLPNISTVSCSARLIFM